MNIQQRNHCLMKSQKMHSFGNMCENITKKNQERVRAKNNW